MALALARGSFVHCARRERSVTFHRLCETATAFSTPFHVHRRPPADGLREEPDLEASSPPTFLFLRLVTRPSSHLDKSSTAYTSSKVLSRLSLAPDQHLLGVRLSRLSPLL
jgi:hypothetical protein